MQVLLFIFKLRFPKNQPISALNSLGSCFMKSMLAVWIWLGLVCSWKLGHIVNTEDIKQFTTVSSSQMAKNLYKWEAQRLVGYSVP